MDKQLTKEEVIDALNARKEVADLEGFKYDAKHPGRDLMWFSTNEEKAEIKAIKEIRKCLKRQKSSTETKKLLAGLEAIECDSSSLRSIDFIKMMVSDDMKAGSEKVSMREFDSLMMGTREIADIERSAEKHQKKIMSRKIGSEKLGEAIYGCRSAARDILTAVLFEGKTPEAAVNDKLGIEMGNTI